MLDVQLQSDDQGFYDLVVDGSDFGSVEGLETALIVSYGTDSRAPKSSVKSSLARRGWVGNLLFDVYVSELGSLLWLLYQSRGTPDTVNFANTHARAALQWMIRESILASVETEASVSERELTIISDLFSVDGDLDRHNILWGKTDADNL